MGTEKRGPVTQEMLNRRLHEAELTIQEFLQFHEELTRQMGNADHPTSAQARYISSRAKRFLQQYRTLRLLQEDAPPPGLSPPERLPLRPLIEEVVETFAPTLNRRELKVRLEVDDTAQLALPSDQLQALVHLLLENAVRFSRAGEILIRTELREQNLDLLVCDQGVGVDRSLLRRLFEGGESDQDEIPPSGIGLWLIRELVERLQASWEIRSDLEEGTEVRVRFGHGARPGEIDPSPARTLPPNPSKGKPTVLVVDDDRFTLNLVNLHLSQDFETLLAQNGAQALEIVRRQAVDLVLLDLRMPDLDGIDVLSEIRELYRETELPVIFLTVEAQAHALARLIELGGNDYLTKPVNSEELVTKLRYHFKQARQFRALRHDSVEQDRAIKKAEAKHQLIRYSLPILAELSLNVEAPLLVFDRSLEVLYASASAPQAFGRSEAELCGAPLCAVIPLDWKGLFTLVQNMGPCLGLRLFLEDRLDPKAAQRTLDFLICPTQLGGALRAPAGSGPLELEGQTILGGTLFRLGPAPQPGGWPDLDHEKPYLELDFQAGFSARFVARADPADAEDSRQLAVDLIHLCLEAWEKGTGKTKYDLAEESGLWTASVDQKGTYRTKTLDRYLSYDKLPTHPRMQTLEKTARFVLKRCTASAPKACEQLAQLLERLRRHLR